ncbi:MAG TPA: tRNA (adenosine(37)-N6)-dimethylallyltransferase MiaA [Armatimonadota bacterium]|nr:tRNA (adenosine(37)-N6)-dimethylallyltransferase MiaA [Armatimonadota bacterium]
MSEAGRRLWILTGPTSVGKTEVSIDVALRLGTEILSADSMAVYRRMETATAKPSPPQRARVPHHLIDLVDASEPFTVADYRHAAVPLIERLFAAGKAPLIVGGTRLYLMALTAPFASGPEPSPELREALAGRPSEALHAELARVDPLTAARLHPSDRKRIVRALEVFETTGRPISELQAGSRQTGGLYDAVWVALIREREELYRRVDARVDEMIRNGLVEEVRGFLREGFTAATPAMQGHGYKEILRALTGEYSLEEGTRLLKRNTRRYVKYQLMWLRGMPHVHYVRADRPHEQVVDEIVQRFRAA